MGLVSLTSMLKVVGGCDSPLKKPLLMGWQALLKPEPCATEWPEAAKVKTTVSPTLAVTLLGEYLSEPSPSETAMLTVAAEATVASAAARMALENMMMVCG